MWQRALGWIEERVDLSTARYLADHKRVPIHPYSPWYYLGGLTLFLIGVQIVSGLLLLLYYRPSAGEAYESVQFIVSRVEFGWLVRNVHSWSANLAVGAAFLHLFSVLFLRSYRKPRELTWVTGVFLLFLLLGFGFSGYLLPWNELAFFATKVGTGIPGSIPIVGEALQRFLRGGDDVTGATLSRFFGLHVALLPALLGVLLGVHLLFVQQQGMSVPIKVRKQLPPGGEVPSVKFVPNFLLRELVLWYVALAGLAALAAFSPWELGVKADAFAPVPPGIRPEWYFLAAFQTLKLLPSHIAGIEGELLGVLGMGLAMGVLVLLPFLDRRSSQEKPSPLITVAGVIALVYLVVMTVVGYVAA